MATAVRSQATAVRSQTAARPREYKDRLWIPRFWNGMRLGSWLSLLARNRLAIDRQRLVRLLLITPCCFFNQVARLAIRLFLDRRIARTEIRQPLIFILGHWRSGTTLLHELLVLDPRFAYPDTYACFLPNHFLLTDWLLKPLLGWMLPKRRPMDNMAAGVNCPQEDEFALCNLGLPSPYLTIAFPNHRPQDQEYLDLSGVSPQAKARWKREFLWFLKSLTMRKRKPLVLKSPPHTARVRTLLEMFPEARFVHIVRDPYVVFPSTKRLWTRLYRHQGLQVPKYEGLDEHIFDTFDRMYAAFERDRHLIEPSRFCEVRYEDLVADPVAGMERVYRELNLGGFARVRPALEDYAARNANYQTNRYEITPETRARIAERWGDFIERYGYAEEPVTLPIEQYRQPRRKTA